MSINIAPQVQTSGNKLLKSVEKSLLPLSVGLLLGVSSSSVMHHRQEKKFVQAVEPQLESIYNASVDSYNAILDYQEKLNTANTLDLYRAQCLCLLHGLPVPSMTENEVIESADSLLLNGVKKTMYKTGASNAEKVEAFK